MSVHYECEPGRNWCGADHPHVATTTLIEDVTCLNCLRTAAASANNALEILRKRKQVGMGSKTGIQEPTP